MEAGATEWKYPCIEYPARMSGARPNGLHPHPHPRGIRTPTYCTRANGRVLPWSMGTRPAPRPNGHHLILVPRAWGRKEGIMRYTFTIGTFSPATNDRDARINERTFRAPACVTSQDNADAFALDVQNTCNYYTRTRIACALNAVDKRMETMDASSASYDKALATRDKLQARLDDFDALRTCGYSYVAGFPALFTWATIRATRRVDSKTDVALRFDTELLRAIYDAVDMDDASVENLRLSVIGFIKHHSRGMENYGKSFDIRFTTAQAREVVHFANASRFNWNRMTIAEREATDNDVLEHCILSALRKTFGWDAETVKRTPSRLIVN